MNIQKKIEEGIIEIAPLAFMRGRTLKDSFVILDEAQNASPLQLKTLITRISDDTKLVIEGDLSQTDKYRANGVPAYQKSGFYDVWKRLGGVDGIYQIAFTKEDCIRSGIVKRVLEQYEKEEIITLDEVNPYELDMDSLHIYNEIEPDVLEDKLIVNL